MDARAFLRRRHEEKIVAGEVSQPMSAKDYLAAKQSTRRSLAAAEIFLEGFIAGQSNAIETFRRRLLEQGGNPDNLAFTATREELREQLDLMQSNEP